MQACLFVNGPVWHARLFIRERFTERTDLSCNRSLAFVMACAFARYINDFRCVDVDVTHCPYLVVPLHSEVNYMFHTMSTT